MKTFSETFRDSIDATNGTVVLTEDKFKEIQRDVVTSCLLTCDKLATSLREYSYSPKIEGTIAGCEIIEDNFRKILNLI